MTTSHDPGPKSGTPPERANPDGVLRGGLAQAMRDLRDGTADWVDLGERPGDIRLERSRRGTAHSAAYRAGIRVSVYTTHDNRLAAVPKEGTTA